MKIAVKITYDNSGTFRASCPALPGCVARGRTRPEVMARIQSAASCYLASLNVPASRELTPITCAG